MVGMLPDSRPAAICRRRCRRKLWPFGARSISTASPIANTRSRFAFSPITSISSKTTLKSPRGATMTCAQSTAARARSVSDAFRRCRWRGWTCPMRRHRPKLEPTRGFPGKRPRWPPDRPDCRVVTCRHLLDRSDRGVRCAARRRADGAAGADVVRAPARRRGRQPGAGDLRGESLRGSGRQRRLCQNGREATRGGWA